MNSQDMIDDFLKTNTVTMCKTVDKHIIKSMYSKNSKDVRAYARLLKSEGFKRASVWRLIRASMKKYFKRELSKKERTSINRYVDRLLSK